MYKANYGKVDGKPHTVTVNDLSENGVNTSIRYGTEAEKSVTRQARRIIPTRAIIPYIMR